MRKVMLLLVMALVAVPAALADNGSSTSPAQRCVAQRTAMGATAFNQLYGTNANDRNSVGKCVSKLTRADQANTTEASAACKAEQDDTSFAGSHNSKTFAEFYGTNRNGHDAFGNCVSQKAHAATQTQQQATTKAGRACRAEQQADAVAFKTKYGTNGNKSNAFGKCVSHLATA
jgi:hypothetical protein